MVASDPLSMDPGTLTMNCYLYVRFEALVTVIMNVTVFSKA
jgi:hypothetical protein